MGNFTRHGGGEQQRLALARQQPDDAAHIADEAHVEHAVGFIDDKMRHMIEAQMFLPDQVQQAPRCRDQYVGAVA
ncbi:MAG: hypothetical protein BGO00_10350 [Alphaproteobacteria bacterium 62-8]|nr:MAG: hypothetical protein BGO00_10350 [Alphaproteobacteria bacterium 62-8]